MHVYVCMEVCMYVMCVRSSSTSSSSTVFNLRLYEDHTQIYVGMYESDFSKVIIQIISHKSKLKIKLITEFFPVYNIAKQDITS